MNKEFHPIHIVDLLSWILAEEKTGQIFGIRKELFFIPRKEDPFKIKRYNKILDTPLGVASGPHTQLAQNIISAWLTGSRYIELKTIQTLDQLKISKPCIDMEDEGYNCEWSQELNLNDSFNQYLDAWIIIHVLHDKFKWGNDIGTIFNMSIGYDFEGIQKDNVQRFLTKMKDCAIEKNAKIAALSAIYPSISGISIPDKISDNITLSTMHGCPPEEIFKIGSYFIQEKKMHTTIKMNPTLLGKTEIANILHEKLKFDITFPDFAFEHDLKYPEAVRIIYSLRECAEKNNVDFSIKLTNTLECINNRNVFAPDQKTMYLSGRALHPISINLAAKIQRDFSGKLDITFSAGADCFNFSEIIACGIKPVTICSDLLKPGGYSRQIQYLQNLHNTMDMYHANNISEFIVSMNNTLEKDTGKAGLENLQKYASHTLNDKSYKKSIFQSYSIKTDRELNYFDCIEAPCTYTCPDNQNIPRYMFFTSKGDFKKAYEVILQTNPFPSVTGMICDHTCQTKCTRINYDNSVLIREIKRFLSENQKEKIPLIRKPKNGSKVAIIGAGPSGLSCAYFLALEGFEVNIYEEKEFSGGMISSVIPEFRLSDIAIQRDIQRIEQLGVKIHFGFKIINKTGVKSNIHEKQYPSEPRSYNNVIDIADLRKNNDFVYIAVGAPKSKRLHIKGEDLEGVIDAIDFLSSVHDHKKFDIGKRVAIIGGGNTAIDAARTAKRILRGNGEVSVLYRRTKTEMPADKDEINDLLNENIQLLELTSPCEIESENGRVKSLICCKNTLEMRNTHQRAFPVKIENSEFRLEFDTIIPAIGQDIEISLFEGIELNRNTNETNLKNVFIGGDAIRGSSTLINAITDGKNAAAKIIGSNSLNTHFPQIEKKFDGLNDRGFLFADHQIKQSKRIFGVELPKLNLPERNGFNVVTQSLSKEQAIFEANRCLYCDDLCNICVSVCPNRANISFVVSPREYKIFKILNDNGKIDSKFVEFFKVKQKYQVLNIANFCNECGNCTTFCPTKGNPCKDKPRLYLTENSFINQNNGYYILREFGNPILKSKINGIIETIKSYNEFFIYNTEAIEVKINKVEFDVIEIKIKSDKFQQISLKHALEMSILLESLKDAYFLVKS